MKKHEKQTTVKGTINRIKYANSEGWSVFSISPDSDKHGPLSCTGTLAEIIQEGDEVTCTGTVETGKYGKQLKCETIIPEPPDTNSEAGVIKLLQRLPGIGPKKAELAIKEHGAKEAWILAGNDPEKVGVHPGRVDAAVRVAQSLTVDFEALTYLLGIGLTDYQSRKVLDVCGGDAVDTVSKNPYKLIDIIQGFGFLTVDKISFKAGIKVGNPARIKACVLYVLNSSEKNDGHVWRRGWELVNVVLDTLTESAMACRVSLIDAPSKDHVRECIYFLKAEGRVVIEDGMVFSKELLDAEKIILRKARL